MKIILLTLALFSFQARAGSQIYKINDETWHYPEPTFKQFSRNLPNVYGKFLTYSFKDNWKNLSLLTFSTALLYYFDRDIYTESVSLGKRLGLSQQTGQKKYLSFKGYTLYKGPHDTATALYFLGDGWLHGSITAGFYAVGMYRNDLRAKQTGFQLAQGLLTNILSVQVLKRTTGRESPFRTTKHKRGNWRFFPDQKKYNKDASKYDAFPSGHISTAMTTFTVITENYAEYNHILKPVQYTTLTLLGFGMLNNGVHWASDYPLALGMGYLFGKIAVEQNRNRVKDDDSVTMSPLFTDGPGLMLTKSW